MQFFIKKIVNRKTIIPFIVALVFFAMDISDIIGRWGYDIYYPMVFCLGIYFIFQNKVINKEYLLFIFACFLSIVLNDIPSYFNSYQRLLVYIVIMICFSGMINSRKIALIRLYILHYFSLLCLIAVVINYVLFALGYADMEKMDIYNETGFYAGSTANNEMGALATVSIMYMTCIYLKYRQVMSVFIKIVFGFSFICCVSMLGTSSSRMALICTLLSIIIILFQFNRKHFFRFFLILPFTIIIIVALGFMFQDKFIYMLEKQDGEIANLDTRSRDELWGFRIEEFKESPFVGVGFASINKYGRVVNNIDKVKENQGRIETGSGWLAVLSQTGIFGAIALLVILIPNIKYLYKNKSTEFSSLWLSGMTLVFILQPITEGYITAIGAILCCVFWLNYSVVESFRLGFLTNKDVDSLQWWKKR